MGECVYYMTVRFPGGTLKKKLPKIQAFFKEGLKAYNFWQKHRGDNVEGEPEGFNFWKEFEKKFPLVTPYVKTITASNLLPTHQRLRGKTLPVWGHDRDGLAGNLDFANEESHVDAMSYSTGPLGDELRYNTMLWHFADWSPLLEYIKKHFGAIKYAWSTDEDGEGGYPSLENHSEIVSDLLKKKEVLPTLMGINPELDDLIATTLKI